MIISFPSLLQAVADAMWNCLASDVQFDCMCGVPYTALPIATVMSIHHDRPMVMRRKEAKDYGLKKLIEGAFTPGQTCLVIEDLVTSGLSVLETVDSLADAQLRVRDVCVLIDRQQGGRANLEQRGMRLHAVFTIEAALEVLQRHQRIESSMAESVLQFIRSTQVTSLPAASAVKPVVSVPSVARRLSYVERAEQCRAGSLSSRLLRLMNDKQSNLCVAVDVTSCTQLLQLADAIGPHICVLKTHVDVLVDFEYSAFVPQLQQLAVKHNFLIFEDRKFADIGNTVALQYHGGVYRISEWAHIVNAHALPGAGIVQGLQQNTNVADRGLLLLAEMSSAGCLIDEQYTRKTVELAEANPDFVIGFIAQRKLSSAAHLIHMTPGVQGGLDESEAVKGDGLGQQYNSPQHVIGQRGSDVIIVGRGVYAAADPTAAARQYQSAGWRAYERSLMG
jgi:uridine monophosphate synthetase